MIRYHMIEAALRRTPWCATETTIQAIAKAVRRSPGIDSARVSTEHPKTLPQACKMLAASGRLSTVGLADPSPEKCVAVIPVFGVIGKYLSWMESDCGGLDLVGFEKMLRQAEADSSVTDIVLHVGSPGGTITGVPEAAKLITQVNQTKPVFAYSDSEMCSAAYWLGCSGSGVFCSESATLGSIGVYLAWIDDSKAMETEGLELKLFKDGTFKASTLPGQLTEEAGNMLQAEVESIGAAFRAHVAGSRNASSGATVSVETMQGQTFRGQNAVEVGLADAVYRSLNDVVLELLTNQKEAP